MIGAGNEVGKRVALVHHLALVVPFLAEVFAAANMGEGEDDPAIVERQPGRREAHRLGRAV